MLSFGLKFFFFIVRMGVMVKEQMMAGKYAKARQTFTDQLDLIDSQSDSVVRSCSHQKFADMCMILQVLSKKKKLTVAINLMN